jgi:hypothetical protein
MARSSLPDSTLFHARIRSRGDEGQHMIVIVMTIVGVKRKRWRVTEKKRQKNTAPLLPLPSCRTVSVS